MRVGSGIDTEGMFRFAGGVWIGGSQRFRFGRWFWFGLGKYEITLIFVVDLTVPFLFGRLWLFPIPHVNKSCSSIRCSNSASMLHLNTRKSARQAKLPAMPA